LAESDPSKAVLISDFFLDTASKSAGQNSFEHAEALVIAAKIERAFELQDSSVEEERFEVCKNILKQTKAENDSNAATAFLHAIDFSSAESLFATLPNSETKSAAGWMREFTNHRNDSASDQLEMTAWFSESQAATNKGDVSRMIEFTRRLRPNKKWGAKGETNWSRIDSVARQISD